jgi:hypothetical protein
MTQDQDKKLISLLRSKDIESVELGLDLFKIKYNIEGQIYKLNYILHIEHLNKELKQAINDALDTKIAHMLASNMEIYNENNTPDPVRVPTRE